MTPNRAGVAFIVFTILVGLLILWGDDIDTGFTVVTTTTTETTEP